MSPAEFAARYSKLNRENPISKATIYRWLQLEKQEKEGNRHALAGNQRRSGRPRKVADGPLAYMLICKASEPKLSMRRILERMEQIKGTLGWKKLPSRQTLAFYWREVPASLRERLINKHRAHYACFGLAMPREDDHANHRWAMDSSKLPFTVIDSEGKTFSPWILSIIDHSSRAIMGYVITRDEQKHADVLAALQAAIMPSGGRGDAARLFGMPEIIHFDLGSIFTCKVFQAALANLDITPEPSPGACPEDNGRIERSFGTLKTEFVAGFIDEIRRKNCPKRGSKIVALWERVPQLLDEWVLDYNHRRIHSAVGCTPFEAWCQRMDQPASLEFDATKVLLALSLRRHLTVSRQGIRVEANRNYHHEALNAYIGSGRKLLCLIDPDGAGETILVQLPGGDFVEARCIQDDPKLAQSFKRCFASYQKEIAENKRMLKRAAADIRKGLAGKPIRRRKRKPAPKANSTQTTPPTPHKPRRITVPKAEKGVK